MSGGETVVDDTILNSFPSPDVVAQLRHVHDYDAHRWLNALGKLIGTPENARASYQDDGSYHVVIGMPLVEHNRKFVFDQLKKAGWNATIPHDGAEGRITVTLTPSK